MAQTTTKWIANLAVISGASGTGKIGSGAATSTQALFSDGAGGTSFRSIISGDIPTLNQNTTGTASNITATTNATLTTLSALTTANALTSATSLAISGSQVSGGTFGAINGSALTNLSAANLSGVLPVGVTGGSGLSIAASQLTGTVGPTYGGTGLTSYTTGDLIYASATNTLTQLSIGGDGQVLTLVSGIPAWATASTGANQTLSNLTSPTAINQNLIFSTGAPAEIQTADDASVATQGLLIETGAASTSGNSGNIIIETGASAAGNSGNLNLRTSNTSGAGNSGNINIFPGNTSAGGNGGNVNITAGGATSTATGTPGTTLVSAGSSNATAITAGLTTVSGGNGTSGAAGGAIIITGGTSDTGNTGNVKLTTPASTATRGAISFVDGSEGTSGYIWTSIDTNGTGSWRASSAGTVSSVSVVSANGFAGTVATATSTPAITISTTITGILQGNGTAISAASTTGTGNVVLSASPTFTGTVNAAAMTLSAALNMSSNQINNLANGTASTDAINLGQLQAAISGLYWQGPAQAFANSNVPLTGGATLTIDGYAAQNGDLVILGNQTTASQNGEYSVSGIGSAYVLTPNGLPTAAGDAWLILNGTVYADSAFVANAAVPAATFTEFAGPTAYVFSAPLLLTGRTVSITQATTSTNGYLSSTDWNTFNNKQAAGNYITALTGDATASGPGSAALTLATVNSNVGSFGSSTAIPTFTVNAKGLITAAGTAVVVAPAGTLSGTTLNSTVVTSSLTTVGTIGTGVWQGTSVGAIYGGTGQTTYTTGDTLYASASNVLSKLPIGSTNQVLTVVAGIPAWAAAPTGATNTEDVLTLNSTDITNQYKDLNHAATGSSASVNSISLTPYNGPEQQKTVDYTVSLTGGVGGVTRITFAGDLATGGNAALVSGDILMVKYAF